MKLLYKLIPPILAGVVLFSGSPASATPASCAVTVQDVQIPVAGQAPVSAYVVRPSHRARSAAGVLYLHWFAPGEPTQNRTEFLAEAREVAARGAVAVLPDLTFPWQADLVGDARDRQAVLTQLAAITTTYRYLLAQPGVDRHRTAVVGHDYGAMYGAVLAAREPALRAAVLMTPDATWANWFDTYWLGLPDAEKAAYRAVFHGLDPIGNVRRLGPKLYLQFAGQDVYIPAATRAEFRSAAPAARISLYPEADHFLTPAAEKDRVIWLESRLGL